ncbi:MAG: hypothetical protein AAGF28_00295 [Pseudomonadota bacterium]
MAKPGSTLLLPPAGGGTRFPTPVGGASGACGCGAGRAALLGIGARLAEAALAGELIEGATGWTCGWAGGGALDWTGGCCNGCETGEAGSLLKSDSMFRIAASSRDR